VQRHGDDGIDASSGRFDLGREQPPQRAAEMTLAPVFEVPKMTRERRAISERRAERVESPVCAQRRTRTAGRRQPATAAR
jgi:hypothetical protein